jgi:LysR family glycine cleavage system transcriptional activator
MARRLPSLNQLRAFEAAARHGSIKQGAEELCVTPAAVGHQVKALEEALGVVLFHRATRKITVTEAGETLAREVGAALDSLEEAVTKARGARADTLLRITVAPFLHNRWLLPRLPRFHAAHPGITIQTAPSFEYVDLATSGFDAALRYGTGDWPHLQARPIFHDEIRPVCAAQLVEGRRLPLAAREVLALPLASARNWPEDWQAWAQTTGAGPVPKDITSFDSRAFMFDAALSGHAVILADRRLTQADESAGRLVELHPRTVTRPQGLFLVTQTRQPDPSLETFAEWLRAEAG